MGAVLTRSPRACPRRFSTMVQAVIKRAHGPKKSKDTLKFTIDCTRPVEDKIMEIATAARGADPFGYRAEFLSLVRLASALDGKR